jgi:hypothetical protein
MAAFLGFPDGKYHIPPLGLRQVATRPIPGTPAGGSPGNPGFQAFFLSIEIEYNSVAAFGG